MKKLIAAALTVAAVSAPIAVTDAAHAAGKNPACITKAEFKKVKNGQSPKKVATIIGSKGKVVSTTRSGGWVYVMREYKACSPFNRYSAVMVTFDNMTKQFTKGPLTVDGKTAIWLHN
ncbi:hypothetical protein [Nocardioides sambongensis]|uniref:hypothetical protein n=1 Tax=Nocardioides sambongensis TaxID=2589074 RepID=UPI00112A5AC4|nr:hypothetical protein [Nocardioides sambongensis]